MTGSAQTPGEAAQSPADRSGAGAVAALRDSWSRYPREWSDDASLNRGAETLGDEWGGPGFADFIVDELVAPYLSGAVDVLELGCGGGKFSRRLAPRCRSLVCADISPAMIAQAQTTLAGLGLADNVTFQVLNGVDFEGVPDESIDFIFSYDVQLHLQPQNVFSYMLDAQRVLRPGGILMLHQVDLASVGGMEHFLSQWSGDTWKHDFDHPRRRGHIYFMSEDQLRALARAAGYDAQRLVSDFPAAGSPFRAVTQGRDLIAFLAPRNRLGSVPVDEVALVRADGDEMVYAVWAGKRAAIRSAEYFSRAGFSWDAVRALGADELAAIPETEPLERWEQPMRRPPSQVE